MTRVATATSSQAGADAAAQIADEGGNAIDCAIAAALVTMNTEPGVCALAGGAYVTVWPADGDPVTIDGNVAVPGRGAESLPLHAITVDMDYGGGIRTVVGAASVAVPGSLAALELAAERYGAVAWRRVVAPSVQSARNGFPLSAASHYYLQYSGQQIFGRSAEGFEALHDRNGMLHDIGTPIVVPHLADSLQNIAENGGESFYRGDLAAAIVNHVGAGGGRLTARDLHEYRAIPRTPLMSELAGWQIASNPPPAVGGTVLAALLSAVRRVRPGHWNAQSLLDVISVQQTALAYRRDRLDLCDDIEAACADLLGSLELTATPGPWVSSSTVHTSAVDNKGNACAITASSGYGSGEMPAGTGLWLNNCLGELELNRRGFDAGPPGRRLPSNMTPGAARKDDQVMAFGSPGADRITTALQQFLINFMHRGMSLEDAIGAPRLHVVTTADGATLAAEPGLSLRGLTMPVTLYPARNMYFGGVGAALYSRMEGFAVAADPRRAGGTRIGGR